LAFSKHPSEQLALPIFKFQFARSNAPNISGEDVPMLIILLIILLLLSVGSYPAWPYSRGWGYYPSGGLGLVVLILVVLLLLGRI